MVEPAGDRRHGVRVGQPPARNPLLRERAAARMAQAAGLDLFAQGSGRDAPLWMSGRRISRPDDAVALAEAHQKPQGRILALAERPKTLPGARPADMTRALPVTGLAADADLRPGGGEAVVGRIVVLAHAGRVTFRAHEVPVLVQLSPMQDVVVLDLLVRVEMEPALAAFVLGPAVPGER